MSYVIKEFQPEEAAAVNAVALSAFSEYRHAYNDWAAFSLNIGNMAALASTGELIVAMLQGRIVGAVVYVGPGKPKQEFFQPEWPILRMLVTEPAMRGQCIGRALTLECIQRARRESFTDRLAYQFHYAASVAHVSTYGIYV